MEGHHLSINFAFDKGKIVSSTPTFWGSNPAIVITGDKKGTRVLKQEMDLGFSLLGSLSPDQLKLARFSEDALPEIVFLQQSKSNSLRPHREFCLAI